MEMINLRDALKQMETGQPFSMSFVTLDASRKTGGKIREIHEAILTKTPKQKTPASKKPKRNPNHWTHATRSFRILVDGFPSGSIRKFHIFLLIRFNGKQVFL